MVKYDKKGNPIYPAKGPQEEYLIVDGYNIIFAWKDLNELSRVNIDSARDKLLDILSNYQGYKSCPVLVRSESCQGRVPKANITIWMWSTRKPIEEPRCIIKQ